MIETEGEPARNRSISRSPRSERPNTKRWTMPLLTQSDRNAVPPRLLNDKSTGSGPTTKTSPATHIHCRVARLHGLVCAGGQR